MKKKYIIPLIFSTLLIQFNSRSQCSTLHAPCDPAAIPREHNVDFQHMRLEVSFEPEKKLVKGIVTHFFTPLRDKVDSIFLDGPDITILGAQLNGKEIKFKYSKEGITFFPEKTLSWDEKDSLRIQYEAKPRRGIYFIGWNDPLHLSRKQIWTQGQAFDNRYWIPCFDLANDKLTTEVIVHIESKYKVLSNGNKIAERQNNGITTWHYKMSRPHPTYLLMLGIGEYEYTQITSSSGVPIQQWYYPEQKERIEPTYRYMKKIFDFLEKEIDVPYPWETYAQIPVQDFMYGAMENTTATIFGDFFQIDSKCFNDRNYVSVNAHELAHQWFGDLVTGRTVNHLWLQESFATHYNLLAEKECFGQDHFDFGRLNAINTTLNTIEKTPLVASEISSNLLYQKGSQILEMIKYVIGREAYNRSIKGYLKKHAYENVDSEDLLNSFHDETGHSMEWFWNQWIYKGCEPTYEVNFRETNSKSTLYTEFSVTQKQAIKDPTSLFKMPIEFEVHYKDGTSDKSRVWIEQQHHLVRIENPKKKKIDFVLFDPNNRIIKNVIFNKPIEMLKAQLLNAPNMLDRYDAALALKPYALAEKASVFQEAYSQNTFHEIKAELAIQCMADTSIQYIEFLKKALTDKDIHVRKKITLKTDLIHPRFEPIYTSYLTDSSYILNATALEKLCTNFPENSSRYLNITKDIKGTYGNNVRLKWLEIAAKQVNGDKYLEELTSYTSSSFEFLTRVGAVNILKKFNFLNQKLINNLLDACINTNARLSAPAKEAINYYNTQNQFKTIIKQSIAIYPCNEIEHQILTKIIQP